MILKPFSINNKFLKCFEKEKELIVFMDFYLIFRKKY